MSSVEIKIKGVKSVKRSKPRAKHGKRKSKAGLLEKPKIAEYSYRGLPYKYISPPQMTYIDRPALPPPPPQPPQPPTELNNLIKQLLQSSQENKALKQQALAKIQQRSSLNDAALLKQQQEEMSKNDLLRRKQEYLQQQQQAHQQQSFFPSVREPPDDENKEDIYLKAKQDQFSKEQDENIDKTLKLVSDYRKKKSASLVELSKLSKTPPAKPTKTPAPAPKSAPAKRKNLIIKDT